MLPSLVINEVRHGIAETLRAQFEPSTELFRDAVHRLIDDPGWIKGPYVQLGLPFVAGTTGKRFFETFETEHPAFLHQEQAWQRCAVHHRSTLVATGTGSGKTECFLYPILDHTARERQKNVRGIKAIVIYPMNALADDQAKRIAALIHETPAFAGIRAGLFVGSGKTRYHPGQAGKNPEQDSPIMEPDRIITDKDVLRNDPPDILLTNYKMLDFLLIRPRDQALWRFNGPDTLRWLVVDELHTFDGAQGTDLAMLIRRLRQRLQCGDRWPPICIGTSATLGNTSDTRPLREYASQIFATDFDEDAVIVERRQGFDDFIGNRAVEHLVADDDTALQALRPRAFKQSGEAVAQLLPAFFADPETLAGLQAGIDTAPGRVRLGEELKKHLLFQSLLRTATQAPVAVDTIADRVRRILSARLAPEANALITALLALVAWARAPQAGQRIDEGTPTAKLNYLVTLRIQLWLQELRRVLSTVSRDPAHIEINSEAGVIGRRERLRLPVIQCRHCRTTGWLTLKPPQNSRVTNSLETIYAGYFARYQDAFLARIYPRPASESTPERTPITALNQTLCGQCGHLANDPVFRNGSLVQCPHCQSDDLLPVLVVSPTRVLATPDGGIVTVHDDTCPVCGERDGQLIIGAQTTSIAAHAVERLWSATLNDHKKLILFSDSVQDAAHRAGYIESKTEGYLMRAGLAKAIATLPAVLPWDRALEALGRCYLDPASPLAMASADFVARFIPPSMEWLRDWQKLRDAGALPKDSGLPKMLCGRMQWRAIEELAHRSDRGRTLNKVGIAALFPDLADLQTLARALTVELREAGGGLETLPEERVLHWAVGSVLALIRAGAIFHLGLEQVAETGDFAGFEFAPLRKHWIPHRGKFEAPRFITRNSGRHGFLHLEERPGNPLFRWAQLALNLELYPQGIITLAYEKLLEALEQRGLGHSVQGVGMRAFGLAPSRLNLYRNLRRLATPSGAQTLWVPDAAVAVLNGLPAWNSPGETFHPESMVADSWWHTRLQQGDVARVIAHEHTGLLERDERIELQNRFMAPESAWQPWYENLLSATPTLEMGIDIGALSSVMLGGVPPNQASFIQRVGRAGRRDGNAAVFAIADASPDGHDQYYFANPLEMLHGAVEAPAIYLNAAEVLRRQIYAFFFDRWVAEEKPTLPDKLSEALDQLAIGDGNIQHFPFNYLDFVNRNEPGLFEAFCRMLGEALRPETREKLEAFIAGTERQKNLRARFLAFFEETHAERESWKKRRRAINAELTRLRKQPADEQTRAEIDQLAKERAGLGQRILQLNDEYLLEAMTNAGLLPNYAFPEEGVALTTVIHAVQSGGEQYVAPVHRYNRPAHAALAEFAPRNTFFAHKSKVQIDQIDMSAEPPVAYRFCAGCHFLTPLAEPAARSDTCPRCGDGRWADGSQVRPLLRLRRAVANIRRADKTRITETDEARNPRFYARQLLMNFAPMNVRSAWTLESDQAIYGFEFIAGASFHDLNLGQPAPVGAAEQKTVIAGNDSAKTGFSLCKSCGMAQPGGNGHNAADQRAHAPDCPNRHATGTEHLLDRLFLYRRFESECLRIMVPKGFGSGERTTYSFMSALQLGLRKRFGGKVDHLRFETMAEADAVGGAGKTYILIYDSVPGGTGYLQQLLAGDADTLTEVLAAAHAAIRDCECRNNPELDGCYRCVFHYRQGRNRRHISRAAALEILHELVEGHFRPKPVKCLSEIDINPDFGSELERRFLPAFKLLGGQLDADGSRFPPVQVTQDIKAGKTAYLLAVGSNKYWVDTQVPIEDPASGRTLCQPDFVISATKSASSMRPIAVFVDGWEYHQKTMAGDARKRATLMLRGEYRVWSVTFEDIEAAHKQKSGTDLDSPLSVLATPSGQQIPAERMPPIAPHDLTANAIALLLRLLGQPKASDQDPLHPLRPVGQHLLMRAVLRAQDITEAVKTRSHAVLHALPEWLRYDAHTVHLHSPGTGPVQWVGKAEPQFMTGASSAKYPHAGALILDDEAIAEQPNPGRSHWRQWLRLANLLQALPGVALLTRSMLTAGEHLGVLVPQSEKPAAGDAAWSQLLDRAEFLDRLAQGFEYLAACGVPAPDVIGAEQEEGGDYRVAEALWEPARVVFLSVGQVECARSWQNAGHTVVEESGQWQLAVESALKGQQP